jgi:hypothetical protein
MAASAMSHSQLATKLIVEGCLAHVAGDVQGKMPVVPIPLTMLERADIGLKQGGQTLFYPLPPTGVFLDLSGAAATVWFTSDASDQALGALETAMKRAYPSAKQLKDEPHPTDARLRARSYQVDLGNSRMALVQVEYPNKGGVQFLTRVVGQVRRQ